MTLLAVAVKYGDNNVSLVDIETMLDVPHSSITTAQLSGRHMTLNIGHQITEVSSSVKVNLCCPRLRQLIYINITWELTDTPSLLNLF